MRLSRYGYMLGAVMAGGISTDSACIAAGTQIPDAVCADVRSIC